MNTQTAKLINTFPVVFLSFKDCDASSEEELCLFLSDVILQEYMRYIRVFKTDASNLTDVGAQENNLEYFRFYDLYKKLRTGTTVLSDLTIAISALLEAVNAFFGKRVILLIDEYDQPIISIYADQMANQIRSGIRNDTTRHQSHFFEYFYGKALKENPYLHFGILTGIQRVAKESIFSKLNNVRVYTVLHERYSTYFGLTEAETEAVLRYAGLQLNDAVKAQYNGYFFGKTPIYNPYSVMYYADSKVMRNYWVNTSTNRLIHTALSHMSQYFKEQFEELIRENSVNVSINLELSYLEMHTDEALWGLLINAGYLKVTAVNENQTMATVEIPNLEVRTEFMKIVGSYLHVGDSLLSEMFECLIQKDFEAFIHRYKRLILLCTSYYDSSNSKKSIENEEDNEHIGFSSENPYHMILLGMCTSLQGIYRVKSEPESGDGRADILLEAKYARYPHIVIEIKQGKNVEQLAQDALLQIKEKRYGADLTGELLCLGIAHDKKRCEAAYEVIRI
jgi:hypothetical protein